MNDCLFCKMVKGDIKPDVVYEDDRILAFRDIKPQAPTHILIIPKTHIATFNDLDDSGLAGDLLGAVKAIAIQQGIAQQGFRTVINCNSHGGQEVFHLHLHLLGGRPMAWPPG